MALNLISGKSYSLENGLSEQVNFWMVVGKATIPIKVDKTLGWRDTELDKPNFSTCLAYMCIPFDLMSGVLSNDCYFVPNFAVENVISTGDEIVPVVIEGKSYASDYELSEDVETFLIQSVGPQPLRIDDKLTWRQPLDDEEPGFVSVDAGIAYNVSGPPWIFISSVVTQVPLFSVTRVLEWQSITGSSGGGGLIGPTGSTGPMGFQGPQGVQGNFGPQGVQGNFGPQGVQGYQGVSGPFFIQGVQEVNSPIYYANIFNTYYGVIYTSGMTYFYLPSISSTTHNGKMITVTDETGSISGTGRGIVVVGNPGETINGEISVQMRIDNMSLTFIARNGKWFIYSSHVPAVWSPFSDLNNFHNFLDI